MRLVSATNWWLRSPNCNSNNGSTNALNVNSNGNWNNNNCSNSNGIRPALMENEMSKLWLKTVYHHQRESHPVESLCMGGR